MNKENILIIDDSNVDRKMVKNTINSSNPNINIIEMEDGRNIFNIIVECNIKAIILDIMLPGKNGLIILESLKKNPDTMHIPVIICSGVDDDKTIKKSLCLGAYDFFEKPLTDKAVRFSLGLKVTNAIEFKNRIDKILYLSEHDELTGLKTRRYFENNMINFDKEEFFPLSIIMADINGLKILNDAYGHSIGDEILKQTAEIINNSCCESILTSRWGGDEFIFLLPKTNKKEIEDIISKINYDFDNKKIFNFSLNLSFGWAIKEVNLISIKELIQVAEDNLYSNKILEGNSVRSNMIDSIINTLHQKNPRAESHSHRVSEICKKIAIKLGLTELEINKVKYAGLLHDIGKIAISESILNKEGNLSDEEWKQMVRHPELGYKILSTSFDTIELANAILAHHERWDGKGYPKGLSENQIPPIARIITVADSFDAMTRERTYKKTMSIKEAALELKRCKGTQFAPDIVDAFLELITEWS